MKYLIQGGSLSAVWCHNNNMTDLSQHLLLALAQDGCLTSHQFATTTGQDHQKIVGTIKSLESLGNVSGCGCVWGKPGGQMFPCHGLTRAGRPVG